jgi:two-component system, OmpR family, phosphate regulon sensor histidine kinase PhoR
MSMDPEGKRGEERIPLRERLSPLVRACFALCGLSLLVFGETAHTLLLAGLGLFILALALFLWPESGDGAQKPIPLRGARFRGATHHAPLLDALAFPIILLDRRSHVVHANEAAKQAFAGLRTGYPLSFAIRAPDLIAAVERIITHEKMAEVSLVERIPLERSFAVLLQRLAPDAMEDAFMLISMQETTQMRRLEAMRADFVANASHELRTPLASILGFVETLQGPAREDVAARAHFLTIMAQQAQRMARLIDDLLSLSKIERNAHIPPSDVVDLPSAVSQVLDALSGIARERGVSLRFTPPDAPALAIGERDELLRLIENLIENAIKYGQSGGYVDIDVTPADEGTITLMVRDYGPGIAAEHLPRLTERFYRADVQESRVLGGTGLGLAIVKHILTRHRGRMAVESEPGQGAIFRVSLPAHPSLADQKETGQG